MGGHGFSELPLAIIGMACRLPGADDLEAYWKLLLDGASAVGELPPHRFDADLYYHPDKGVPGKSYSRLGGVVPERAFEPGLCPIPDHVVASSDPLHLAMLEVAAEACRHAGLNPLDIPLRNTGVYIGHARGGSLAGEVAYAAHLDHVLGYLDQVDAFARLPVGLRSAVVRETLGRTRGRMPAAAGGHPDVTPSAVAGLIAQAFGLDGPYMAVDAACASSLFALALAAHALHDGQIDMAIVGGASYSNWYSLVIFSHAQALSATGSFPFDARADGFISSDGYAAVVVKTLPRALADGDPVWGVIRGIGLSCDGRGKSLWAPRKEGQVEAIRRAYAHGLDPGRVQYIEAHGTSTQLGDATEIEALAEVLRGSLPTGARIPIASAKANIGHARETAGLAGLIKTLLAMRHGVVPPATHFEIPNPEIPWDSIPFFVPTSPLPWPPPADGHPRRAAVDAFGIGGLNAHVVVDDGPAGGHAAAPPAQGTQAAALPRPPMPPADPHEDAVAIVGMGAILPGARTIAAYWHLLSTGADPKGPPPPDRDGADPPGDPAAKGAGGGPGPLGGFVTDFAIDWQRHRIPPRQVETADPLQFMLLDAADQALGDAGYRGKAFDGRRAAVVVGTGFGGDFARQLNRALRLPELQRTLGQVLADHGLPETSARQVCQQFAEVFLRHHQAIHDETGSYTSSTLASRISKTLNLMGGAIAVDAGEASSLAALGTAANLLRSGSCDVVFCAGAQRSMDPFIYRWYASRGALSPDRPRAAFDATADGFVPGEGVALVLLKRLRDARRDGDPVRAVVRGFGAGTDVGAPGGALLRAIQRALAMAAVEAGAVAAVEAAGTGVPRTDAEEAAALARGYAAQARGRPLLVGSLAGQIGHTQGASGMASLLKLTLALEHGRMPRSVGLAEPAAPLADETSPLRVVPEGQALPAGPDGGGILGGVSALALRGLAYHVVLERPADAPPRPAAWRIVRLGDATLAGLRQQLARRRDAPDALFAGAQGPGFTHRDRVRLGLVADTPHALGRKLRLVAEHLATPAARAGLEEQGAFCREVGAAPPRVAFLFAGQGSQYAGMFRELVREVPAAADMLRQMDAALARLGHPAFAEIAWEGGATLGNDVWRTQLAVLLGDLIAYAALTAAGIRPDVISAHSYGEYPALVAAGAWTLEQAIRVTRGRCEAIEACGGARGALLSTTAPPEAVERMAAALGVDLWVANYNAPDQTVVGGAQEAVAALGGRLAAEDFDHQVLPVPRPFHTPLMAGVREPLRRALEGETILPPRIPVLSSVTNRYVADPLDIRSNLVEQLTAPVRYVDLVRRLVDDGATALVEVGPRQVLTRLHRRIAAGRDVAIIACDNPKRPGGEQIWRVRALLECAGVEMGGGGNAQAGGAAPGGPGPRSAILHFDATAHRRQRRRRPAEAAPEKVPGGAASPTPQAGDELEAFLVRFVCEQTGYPPDLVDLDADLEADLGLDSIKKAQLFGEVREQFDVGPLGKLALEDFPTLRHVLDLLRRSGARPRAGRGGPPGGPSPEPAPPPPAGPEPAAAGAAGRATAPPPGAPPGAGDPQVRLNVVRVAGTPYQMGAQHAQSQADHIRAALERYTGHLGPRLAEMGVLREALAQADRYIDPAGLDELRGMADVLGVPPDHLVAYNLGLHAEYVPGCTQFALAARGNGPEGMIHAANEDWGLALVLPKALTRLLQVRRPAGGIPHLTFGVSGQLGGLTGINASGLAISSTLLLDRPRRAATAVGTIHPAIVRSVLERATDLESAVEVVRGFRRGGAWSLCLSHAPTDQLLYLEYDGPSLEVRRDGAAVASTNHCLLHQPLAPAPEHSLRRLRRLQALLGGEGPAPCTARQAQAILRDRYDLAHGRATPHPTMNTIRRVDTLASIVMRPARGDVWVTSDPVTTDDADRFHHLDVGGLLGLAPPQAGPAAGAERAAPPSEVDGRIMRRFVLRAAGAPLKDPPDGGGRLHGPALILGRNPTAGALRARLEALGAAVLELPAGDEPEEALAALQALWRDRQAPHLFLLTPRDGEAAFGDDLEAWTRRRRRGLMLPYLVCQRWLRLVREAGLTDRASLVAATALGGDLGFGGGGTAVEGGGLAGLLKSIHRESPGLLVKVIDAPPEDPPEAVAAAICGELAPGTPELEVGYVRGRRRVVRAVPRPANPTGGAEIPQGGTWVITGGARGITALVAREFGRRFGLKLHLIGRSPAPRIDDAWCDLSQGAAERLRGSVAQEARRTGGDPVAAWRTIEKAVEIDATLRALARAGVSATYHSCDVSDRAALAEVLERIRRRDGPIQGIIHGAGVEEAGRLDRKAPEKVAATVAAKVDGALALMALTRADPLAYFVAFGSISGRFGGHGQTDYALASDLLAKLVGRFRAERPACAAVAIHWPPWDEVGMAVRPETKVVLEAAGQRFMPPQEGVEHLLDELRAGAPEAEVLIIDRPERLDRDRTAPPVTQWRAYQDRQPLIADAPLVDGIYELREGEGLIAETRYDPARDPFLAEHRYQGVPILPAAVAIESLAEAASILGCGRPVVGLRDVEVVNGLRFFSDRPQVVRIAARAAGHLVRCEARADFYTRDGRLMDPERLYLRGTPELGESSFPIAVPAPDEPETWREVEYPDGPRAVTRGPMYLGPPFRCLRQMAIEGSRGWGRILAPPPGALAGPRGGGRWIMAPAALDGCFQAAGAVAYHLAGTAHLPQALRRLRLGRPPGAGEICTVCVTLRHRGTASLDFDFLLLGEDRAPLLAAEGYRCVSAGARGSDA